MNTAIQFPIDRRPDALREHVRVLAEGSRLVYRCGQCASEGGRHHSLQLRPDASPSFVDVCPNCGSTNVDIIDPVTQAAAERSNQAAAGRHP